MSGTTSFVAPRVREALVVLFEVLADLTALLLSLLFVLLLRSFLLGPLGFEHYRRLGSALLLYPMTYALYGLYPGYGIGPVEELRSSVLATSVVSVTIVLLSFLLKDLAVLSRLALVGFWMVSSVVVPLVRAPLRRWLAETPWWGEPVAILGAGNTGLALAEKLKQNRWLGYVPVACLDDDPHKHGLTLAGLRIRGPLKVAPELQRRDGIRVAAVAMPGLPQEALTQVLSEYTASFRKVIVVPDVLGLPSLLVASRDLDGMLGLEVHQNLLYWRNQFLKRAADLVLSVPLLLLSAPLVLVAGALVKFFSPGPIFYAQERDGESGTTIRVWKIRTMVPNAEAALSEYLAQNPAAKAEWDTYMKLRHDPRLVPHVGHLLRRLSIDELPQFWNVVMGEMSLVGPRPLPEYHLARFDRSFRNLRNRVRPGLTGLWQVSARSDGDLRVQEELDSYYIRNWSIWLDAHILARTAGVVLFGKGAY